ncbi:DUF2919 domain-containing protein [Colwellia sp. D2M02]|uniref:DUF2919 family protein n=1 Tax=Colwellia sp. D2M02 TaxID=2841562 RepID=UPI001C084E48|nr:DUF2919 family protein [Colwellia sp. D2M02]MBU2891928.1 DUF2919 domain-containing protein [Colwellia sp. D2M02]
MDKKTLKNLPLTAFNEAGWLKPPLWVYINLIFMAKGLIIFILSLASLRTGDQILAVLYPDKNTLYIAIALSVVPLATLVSFTLGEIQDNLKLKKLLFLLCAAEIAGEISFAIKVIAMDSQPLSSPTLKLLIIQVSLLFFAITSKKVIAFFQQITNEEAILKD